ncbi:glycoside hydrolase family 15 protein [soil metagenome]
MTCSIPHVPRNPPIGDYAAIGDCHTVALVSRSGSIDWLTLPHYGSPSLFAALLDCTRGGCFAISPTADFDVKRAYRGATNVLDTVFRTASGRVRLTDCMTLLPAGRPNGQFPQAELLRCVEAVDGEVELELWFAPRPGYGARAAKLRINGERTAICSDGKEIAALHADAELVMGSDGRTVHSKFRLRAGERRWFSFTYSENTIGVLLPLEHEARRRLDATLDWWTRWSNCCSFTGPYRDAVVRSALVLKLLSYSLSGAVVAAATTSLPEVIGGQRNWDYRYCWLRDASLTLRAFMDLNYFDEGAAFLSWLLHATRLTRPKLSVMYDVYGEHKLRERILDHLQGYRGSRPVRVGNAASEQFQLDVYGEILMAARLFVERGGELDRGERKLLAGFGDIVLEQWPEPDDGIWEIRGERQHYTYSKMMCWAALESLLFLYDVLKPRTSRETLRSALSRIRDCIEHRGYNADLQSYVSRFDGHEPDASLLTMARSGYMKAGDERMRGTFDFIDRELGKGPQLYRYRPETDGLPGREGTFGLASFWAVEYLARRGDLAQARDRFERLLSLGNDVGLFAEEMDPDDGSALGNFPQAFTHVGVIAAALSLREHA